jgi:hypothetical protein
MGMLKDGAEFLSDQLHASASEPVVYVRGDDEVDLSAIIGRMEGAGQDTDGYTTDGDQVDFIIAAADLVIDAAAVEPEIGDYIKHTRDGVEYKYTLARDELDRLYRRCDEHGFDIRVHTICKGVAE